MRSTSIASASLISVLVLLPLLSSNASSVLLPAKLNLSERGYPPLMRPLGPSTSTRTSGHAPALPSPGAPSGYTLEDLGTLGGNSSTAFGINDHGQIVGSSETSAGTTHAFLWQDGVMTDLGTLGGISSGASAINSRGQIVGASQTASGLVHAFLWQNGVMTDLGTLGGSQSYAIAINNRGQIVGNSLRSDLAERAFLWEQGVMRDLGTLGGTSSFSLDINSSGDVVGIATTLSGLGYPFLYRNGTMTSLSPVTEEPTFLIWGINDRRQMVGYGVNSLNNFVAVLFQDGVITELVGGAFGFAADLNDAGQIVGYAALDDGLIRAVLWQNGAIFDLGGGPNSAPFDINNRGEIVGGIESAAGTSHAALWSPARNADSARGGVTAPARVHGLVPSAHAALADQHMALRIRSPLGVLPLEFELPDASLGPYLARIYDARGRVVQAWEGVAVAGSRQAWDGLSRDGAATSRGVYFLEVRSATGRLTSKFVIAR